MCENANNTLKEGKIKICDKVFSLYYIDEGDSSCPENDRTKYGLIGGKIANYEGDEEKLSYWLNLLKEGCWCRTCHKLAKCLKSEAHFEDNIGNTIISVPSTTRSDIVDQLEQAFKDEFPHVKICLNILSKITGLRFRGASIEEIKNNLQNNPLYNKNSFVQIKKVLIIDNYYSRGVTMRAVYEKIMDLDLLRPNVEVLFAVPGKSKKRIDYSSFLS